jgi:Zn-finger protein
MPLKDAENEARGIWRKQKRGELCLDSNQPEGTHQDGEGKEYQPLRTGGENWARSDFHLSSRETTAGGILRELMDEIDEQSAYHSSQLQKLSDRRRHLEQLYQELQAQAREGNDGESEDDEELEDDE